eukprot:EG_transcript_51318
MTGQCKFGAKCNRLHPSVVPSPEPQQVLTLMLPLAMVLQVMPIAPTQPSAAMPAVPQRRLPAAPRALPSLPAVDLHSLGPVTVWPPSPDSHPPAFQPLAPAASFPGALPTPTAPAATATPVPSNHRL